MAAMLLLALFAEQSKHLVAEAHQPETTGLSQRERWQKIIDEFATYRRETGDFSPKKQQTQWQRMGYNYSMPYSYNEPSSERSDKRTDDTPPSAAKATQPQPEPAAEPTGPQLPFQIFPASLSPSQNETAGATRANDLFRDNLLKTGWEGGTPSEKQFNGARSSTLRSLHPDLNPNLSPTDIEAGKLVSGQTTEIKHELYGDSSAVNSGETTHSEAA